MAMAWPSRRLGEARARCAAATADSRIPCTSPGRVRATVRAWSADALGRVRGSLADIAAARCVAGASLRVRRSRSSCSHSRSRRLAHDRARDRGDLSPAGWSPARATALSISGVVHRARARRGVPRARSACRASPRLASSPRLTTADARRVRRSRCQPAGERCSRAASPATLIRRGRPPRSATRRRSTCRVAARRAS